MAEVRFLGNVVNLAGEPPRVGERAREFTVHRFSPGEGIVPVTLADLPAKPRLVSVVPSLDTPVCSAQTKMFEQHLAAYGDKVAAYTISVDLPFAQVRWCGSRTSPRCSRSRTTDPLVRAELGPARRRGQAARPGRLRARRGRDGDLRRDRTGALRRARLRAAARGARQSPALDLASVRAVSRGVPVPHSRKAS